MNFLFFIKKEDEIFFKEFNLKSWIFEEILKFKKVNYNDNIILNEANTKEKYI